MSRHEEALMLLHAGTVIPAIPTVLNAERRFDEARQRRLVRYYLEAGAGGIAVAVHTSQFAIRKFRLFEPIISAVGQVIDQYEKETSRVIIRVCGVCGETNQAVREAETAKKYGYDTVLASPGGLSHLSEEALIARTKAVAEVLPVIGFYLQPAAGGRIFTYGYWEKLCALDGLAAIKCASFNRYSTVEVARAAAFSDRADKIALYTGNDDNIVSDFLTEFAFNKDGREYCTRFRGGLLGHWSVWTSRVCELFPMLKNGVPTPDLMTLGAQITDANSAIFDTAHQFAGCIPGIHEILRRQGLLAGIWCLDPNEVLSPGQAGEIDRVCKMYPWLNDDVFVKEFIERYRG